MRSRAAPPPALSPRPSRSLGRRRQNVLLALTKNGSQLIKTALLWAILLWIYTIVIFSFMRWNFDLPTRSGSSEEYCETLLSCFMVTVHQVRRGVRGAI